MNERPLSSVVTTDEITDDTIVKGPIMRLIQKTFARSQAFGKLVDPIDMS